MLSSLLTFAAATLSAATAVAVPQPVLASRANPTSVELLATSFGGHIGLGLNMNDGHSLGNHGQDLEEPLFAALNFTHMEMQIATSCPNCTGFMPIYRPKTAMAIQILNPPLEGFNKGSITAVYQETISVGGYAVDKQDFGGVFFEVSTVRPYLSAVAGMGFEPARPYLKASKDPKQSFMQRLSSQWPEQVFGLYIQKAMMTRGLSAPFEGTSPMGEITFGGLNESYMDGPMKWYDLDGKAWRLPIDDIKVNGKSLNISALPAVQEPGDSEPPKRAIYMNPSKRSLAGVPASMLAAMMAEIPGTKLQPYGWTVPCNATFTTTFTLGGVDYDVSGPDAIFYMATGRIGPKLDDNEYCRTAVLEVPDGESAHLGRLFFANVYSAFRLDNPQIGLAKLKQGFPVVDSRDPESVVSWDKIARRGRPGNRSGNAARGAPAVAPITLAAAFFFFILL